RSLGRGFLRVVLLPELLDGHSDKSRRAGGAVGDDLERLVRAERLDGREALIAVSSSSSVHSSSGLRSFKLLQRLRSSTFTRRPISGLRSVVVADPTLRCSTVRSRKV